MSAGREMFRHGFVRDQGGLAQPAAGIAANQVPVTPMARLPQRRLRLIVRLVCG